MNTFQRIITIMMCIAGTMLCRFAPFIILSRREEVPKRMRYLGKYLTSAIFALLIVYCLKDVNILGGSHGLPELISIALIVIIHLRLRNTLVSIAAGTIIYMILVQMIFI